MEKVYKLLKRVPRGRVTTYGALAKAAGILSPAVGILMRKNPYAPFACRSLRRDGTVPCHRVVASDGKLGGYSGKKSKASMLKAEGIKIKNGKIDLKKYLFKF